jgi:catechol 2,3-dioxygenase-like lactoylglutathione lyase family enzyme
MANSLQCYRERLGFAVLHEEEAFAVVGREDCVLHLWLADDLSWRSRDGLAVRPVRSGAESFLAGTASCRIRVGDERALNDLYDELRAAHVLHPVSQHGVTRTDFGDLELHASDPDGNLLSFFWRPEARR